MIAEEKIAGELRMLKKKQLIKDTLMIIDRLKIDVTEDILQMLKWSLSEESYSGEVNHDYCELPISGDEVDRLVDVLFDAEAEYAPKGLGLGSEEDERRGKDARTIAKIVNEWNIDGKQ